ncbi:gliding motility-associated-like protein [Filimonas zeae]|uniref:PKD domain-containing protein n=1 Tax=Filimonas zeae TaxID=1737353 RepID=UPI00166AA449|nr:PKD domain-containing protein [Filimonas zeae]MDR6339099.1 gliding motility-associated-like protein [Filimonas zeae]
MRRSVTSIISVLLLWLTAGVLTAKGQLASSREMDFVVVYPFTNTNQASIYICTRDEPATVTLNIRTDAGITPRVYQVAARTAMEVQLTNLSTIILFAGVGVSHERVFNRCVEVHSTAPISLYSHFYSPDYAGGTQVLPVDAWGFTYQTMDAPYDNNGYVCVAAAFDDTRVEITPPIDTEGGRPAGVPFTVDLKKGQVYQMLSSAVTRTDKGELTGTRVRSVPGASGRCQPVAVYAGASSMYIHTEYPSFDGSSDFEIKQMTPLTSLGKRFLTAPYSASGNSKTFNYSIIRIMVTNPATVVKVNGVVQTGLINNTYYQLITKTASYIEADQPIAVAQCMLSRSEPNYPVSGEGDGEMVMISPLENAGKAAEFINTYRFEVLYNYVTLVIPTEGLKSLTIDGSNTFDHTYPHPNAPGYTVVIKRWISEGRYCAVKSDSAFTALAYGMVGYESYVFDVTRIHVPKTEVWMGGEVGGGITKASCIKDSFGFVLKTEYKPERIEWALKGIAGLVPNAADVVQVNPVPDSVVIRDGWPLYYYTAPGSFHFTAAGSYAIPVTLTIPVPGGCSIIKHLVDTVKGKALPVADFTTQYQGCLPFTATFTAGAAGDTSTLVQWNWRFGADKATTPVTTYGYNTTGKKTVALEVTSANGCKADTVKEFTLTQGVPPVAAFTVPATVCLPYGAAVFTNQSTYGGNINDLQFTWQFGEGGVATGKTPEYHYQSAGSYNVTLIATAADGCADTVSHPFAAFAYRPKAGLNVSATAICINNSISFTDASAPASGSSIRAYSWQLGDGAVSTQASPVKVYNTPGTFTIMHHVTSSDGCVSDTASATVTVYDTPKVDAGPDQSIIQGSGAVLRGNVVVNGAYTFEWSPVATLVSSNTLNPAASPPETQRYYLQATTGNMCTAKDSVLVTVLLSILPPNTFTPNGDGIHDTWVIEGLQTYRSATVQVFSRWGAKVFESKGYAVPWNGMQNGNPLPAGTYYYIINPGTPDKPRQTGTVTIIR